MTLREQLADRFQEWACARCDLPREQWLGMADECIRQMEYARRQTFDSVRDYLPDVEVHEPLTAAPEGWKP